MGIKPAVILLLLSLGLSLSTLSAVAQEAPSVPQSPENTFYSSSRPVLVDVVALNAKSPFASRGMKKITALVVGGGSRVEVGPYAN